MRAALRGLTIRGRCFVAAGLTSVGCALVLQVPDLLRVGIFVLALPLAAVAVVARTRYRLSCSRRVEPARVGVGEQASVHLRVENVSRMPTGLLLVEDSMPYALGSRPRFVLERLDPQGVRELSYPVRSDVRGKFRVGPLSIRLADPFGLVELVRSFQAVTTLVVTPAVIPLSRVSLGGGSTGDGDAHPRIVAAAGEDDVATREYRYGDDLRRVHWRSTAHYGELMVRREEQYWQSYGSLLLDTRGVGHRGDGPGSSFEWAVSAAASVGVYLAREKFNLRFFTDAGQPVSGPAGSGSFEGMLLDTLAVVTPSRTRSLRAAVAALRHDGAEELLVAVLGAMEPQEAEALALAPVGGSTRIAMLVDSASWTTLSPAGRQRADDTFATSVRLFRQGGWRVVPIHAGDPLAAMWPMAGGAAAGSSAAPVGREP